MGGKTGHDVMKREKMSSQTKEDGLRASSETGFSLEWADCAVCGESRSELLFTKTYYGAALRGIGQFEYRVVRCPRCGLVFVNPRIGISSIRMLYALYPDLRVVVDVFPQEDAFYGFARRKYLGLYLNALDENCRGKRALDVLCRDGSFLEDVRRVWPDSELHGYEFRPPFIDRARGKGLNVFGGSYIDTVNEAQYPDRFFDVVFVRHVLEHFYEPGSAVREFSRILKDDGLLIIEVPNVRSINRLLFGKEWIVFSSPRQLFHFSPNTLKLLLGRHNFSVDRIEFPWFYYQMFDGSLAKLLAMPIMKFLGRARGGAGGFLNSLRAARVKSSKFPLDPFSLLSSPISMVGAAVGRTDVMIAYARKNRT